MSGEQYLWWFSLVLAFYFLVDGFQSVRDNIATYNCDGVCVSSIIFTIIYILVYVKGVVFN